jgi:hypothetical protein
MLRACARAQCCRGDKTVQYRQVPRSAQPEGSDLLDDLNDDEFDDDAVEAAEGGEPQP